MKRVVKIFPGLREEAELFCEALFRSYSVIFFSNSRLFGAVLLSATFMVPAFGMFGLAGVSIAYVAARLFGFDSSSVRKGLFLFNPLLSSLALAYLESWQPLGWGVLSVLLVAASVGTLFVSVALADLTPRYFALPPLSLPFVGVGFLLFALFHALDHVPLVAAEPFVLVPSPGNLPGFLKAFLQAFGAIFFLPHAAIGLVILICLVAWSRLAVLYAVVGYVSGILFMQGLGMETQPDALGWIAFNFIFCGIALGGIFQIPSRGSLLLVVFASCFSVIVAFAVKMGLCYLGLPPLALPLNLVILSMLYALKCRPRIDRLIEIPFEPGSPEANFKRYAVERARFPETILPHLQLPFFGERTVSQSFNGDLTHRGKWSEALDFEIVDEHGNKFTHWPLDLEGNYLFGTPVLSPCSGTVAKVVNDVPDNLVDEINTDCNWGNLVIIRKDDECYVKLCHLQQGSVDLIEGAHVVPGQMIGRCGNSGRSPVPHLHLQVQESSLVGGHTVPFRLAHYCTADGRYHASGIPGRNDTVSAAGFDAEMSACFEFGETAWPCRLNGSCRTVHAAFDADGDRILSMGEARLTARIQDRTCYTLNYEGRPDNVLYYIHLGLARVPFIPGDNVCWSDRVDIRPLLRPWAVVLMELAGPFFGYPLADVEYNVLRSDDGTIRITSEIRYPWYRGLLRSSRPAQLAVSLSNEGIEIEDLSSGHPV